MYTKASISLQPREDPLLLQPSNVCPSRELNGSGERPKLWNALPDDTRLSQKLAEFKVITVMIQGSFLLVHSS